MWDWSRQTWSQEPSFSKLSVAAGVTANELILIPSSPPHNQPAKERESHFTSCLKESGLCVFVLCAWGEFGCRCARICQPVCDGANLPALTMLDRRVVRKWHYPEGKRRGGEGRGGVCRWDLESCISQSRSFWHTQVSLCVIPRYCQGIWLFFF